MPWQFHREEQQFELLPEGKYRLRIKSAEKAQSQNGNDMLILQFEVSGSKKILYHYIVFLEDRPEITNRMLTQFFDSFSGIDEGDLNTKNWIGKVGAAQIKHEVYNGDKREKVSWFVHADKQGEIPAWQEPDGSAPSASGVEVDNDLPF